MLDLSMQADALGVAESMSIHIFTQRAKPKTYLNLNVYRFDVYGFEDDAAVSTSAGYA